MERRENKYEKKGVITSESKNSQNKVGKIGGFLKKREMRKFLTENDEEKQKEKGTNRKIKDFDLSNV